MGGGNSNLRKSSVTVIQRLPCESQTSYKIRVKFQTEKTSKTAWYGEVLEAFGTEPLKIEDAIRIFEEKMNTIVSIDNLKSYYGMTDSEVTVKQIGHVFGDLSYNPTIGALYSALLKEREWSDSIWNEFLVEFQGYNEKEVHQVNETMVKYTNLKAPPSAPSYFAEYLLSPANSACHPRLCELLRFDRPISEYFIRVGKISDFSDCKTTKEICTKFASTILDGARVVEVECSGGASDGKPRAFGDIFGPERDVNSLPTIEEAFQAIEEARAANGFSDHEAPVCNATNEPLKVLPLILIVTCAKNCDASTQEQLCDLLETTFKNALSDFPAPNADGSIWSPMDLENKVVIVTPTSILPDIDELENNLEDEIKPGEPLIARLTGLAHMQMLTVHEIRPLLDQAKSRDGLRRLLQTVVLTLTSSELCAHIVELSSITDVLLVHVQAAKRRVMELKQGNLTETAFDESIGQDLRNVVQFSELTNDYNVEAKVESEPVYVEKHHEVEPLRGWRYGAQIIPVEHCDGGSEATLQSMALFRQAGGYGLVPRLPRSFYRDLPSCGFVDLYEDFTAEYAKSLYVTILSACRLPRRKNNRAQPYTEPYFRVYCNNGTGLKQVAVTSTVVDNGYNCLWEEDFEYKIHISDISSAASIIFVANAREENELVQNELAFASVSLWCLSTGYRSLSMHDMSGKEIPGSKLFVHFDWEVDCE